MGLRIIRSHNGVISGEIRKVPEFPPNHAKLQHVRIETYVFGFSDDLFLGGISPETVITSHRLWPVQDNLKKTSSNKRQ